MLVFLDTDKPIYQPRQKVNIRLVTIDSDYKPIDGVIEVGVSGYRLIGDKRWVIVI